MSESRHLTRTLEEIVRERTLKLKTDELES